MQRLLIGQGATASTIEELDALWASFTCELILDGQRINLPAFGTRDWHLDEDTVRLWNVVLDQPTLGKHMLRWACSADKGESGEVTWTFTVVGVQNYPTLPSALDPGQHPYGSESAGVSFLLYLPDQYGEDLQRQWPLILYLHGMGEKGYDLDALRRQPLPEMLEHKTDFPFVVVSPQLPPELHDWSDMIDSLDILLREVQSAVSTDPRRVYLTGLSMGGAGTWQLALQYPQRFAALVPIAGYYLNEGYTVPDNLCDLRDVPVWAFHGASDSVVPSFGAEVLVEAFSACGGNIQFTLYATADHEETWRQAYADTELYAWLLSQTLR